MANQIGRFEIRSELGRGAQSVVYLAYDPRLQREVAIKTLHFARSDPRLNEFLLAEARTVSNLRHPNIVPIFEADEQDGDPYLVFELVAGHDLGQIVREQPLPPARAAAIMAMVLDALAQAHEQNIIHRDLKPSNILIDANGTPRVMDFGIATRVSEETAQETVNEELMGTPAYLAPEYINGRPVGPRNDLYAAGLVLLETLTGRRVVQGTTLEHLLYKVAHEAVKLPEDVPIDERLGDIILKACAFDPEARFATARQMKQALDEYLGTSGASTVAVDEDKIQSTLQFLLRRMRHKSDFPALSDSISAINKLTNSDRESVNKLSTTVLRDYALTNKILRLVNSAYYRQAGGGNISTISRAVIVLGFDAIRNIAITVLLFEHLQDKANAGQLKEAFLRANLSGVLAQDASLKPMVRDTEESFICSLFHGLGRLLAQYYFPEEVEEIRKVIQQKNCSEDTAAAMVLGISFEDLGIGIARNWGFPSAIVNSMRRLPAGRVKKPATPDEALRVVAGFSNELCEVIAATPPEERLKAMKQVNNRFLGSTQYSDEQLQEVLESSFEKLSQVASILHVNLTQSPFARQVKAWFGATAVNPDAAADEFAATVVLGETQINAGTDEAGDKSEETADASPVDTQTILAAGIQDITNSLVEDASLNDVLRIALETMYRAMGFTRVLMCLRDVKSGQMTGRFGFGPDTNEVARHFHFPANFAPDVFCAAISKGLDILINDVNDPKIRDRIPEWYRRHVPAQTFVLLPLLVKGKPVALIYCDKERAGEITIPEKELSLLKTLRNQVLLAMKQVG